MEQQPMQPQKEPIGKRTVLDELRRSFDQKIAASDAIDNKLQSLLNSASLVIALLSLLQVAILRQQIGSIATIVVLILVALLYAGMFVTIFWGMGPRDFKLPISRNWEELGQRYFDESEDTVLERLIADYLEFGDMETELLRLKAHALKLALALFTLTVIVLLISMVFTLALSAPAATLKSPVPTPTP